MNAAPQFPVPPRPPSFTPADQARWQAVFAAILKTEGGWSNNAADRGGATKYGISLRFALAVGHIDANRDGFADLDLNLDRVIDGQDMALLTPEIAEALYFQHFWIGPGIWTLPPPMDSAVFDQAVNGGTTAAIRLLQRACTRVGFRLADDGVMGPATRAAAIMAQATGRLLAIYREEAANRYRAIVSTDPSQSRFLNGWLRRAEGLGRV